MKSLESSPASRIFSRVWSRPVKADHDRFEPPMGSPPRRHVRRRTRRSSSLFDTLRIDHEVRWSVFTPFFVGNRERLAGVQGAAMSPLVAGTMPATSGMEALGPSPSRRYFSAGPLSRPRAGERVPFTDEDGATIPPSTQAVPPCRRVEGPHTIPRTITLCLGSSASTSRPPAIPHELQRLAASRRVRPFGPVRPSIRADHIHDRAPLTASVDRRLEARTGTASPSDPRPPHGEPGAVVGRPLQPCPLVIPCRVRLESHSRHAPAPAGAIHEATRRSPPAPRNFLFSTSSAPAGTSPVSTYFHSATRSFRANATIPTLRSRVFPAPNRR